MFGESHRKLRLISEILGDILLTDLHANEEIAGIEYTGIQGY